MPSRAEQKARTRTRVLDAARKLFAEPGYHETTVRAIARAAGVATGSVFTTFESKEDVLLSLAAEQFAGLAAHLEKTIPANGSARERLKAAFAAAYDYDYAKLELLMAQFGASWSWSRSFEERNADAVAAPFRFFWRLVEDGLRKGEIRKDVDVAVLGDLLIGLYIRNFRHGWYRQLSAAQMAAFAARQVDLLLDGAAPR